MELTHWQRDTMFANIDVEMSGVITVETVFTALRVNVWNQLLWADPRRIGLYFVTYDAWGTVAIVSTDAGEPVTNPITAGKSLLIKNAYQFALDGPMVCKNWWASSPGFTGITPMTVYEQWQIKEPGQIATVQQQVKRTVVSPAAIRELSNRVRRLGSVQSV